MKKKLFFVAIAITALAGCTSNEYLGDLDPTGKEIGDGAISFNYEFQNATRAESNHATSAANLGNQFIVWGEKNSGAADTKDAPAAGHIVFPNYQVNYGVNTAYTTTSNTKDWEYVGYTHSANYQTNIKYKASASSAVAGSSAAQTIKYWDYSAGSYTFTAVSASKLDGSSKTDIENGYVKIQKNIDDNDKASEKGYTITVTADADLTKLYFSDRTIITKSAGTNRDAVNTYGGNVTLKFRNTLSQVRVGIYETLSGYDISDIHFYVDNGSGEQITEAKVSSDDAFGAICPNIKGQGYNGTLTVTYSEETGTLNQPIVSASGSVNTNLILGTNTSLVTTAAPLGTSATSPTWDTSGGDYSAVLLQGAHTTNMKVKCDYTLYNSVSGETINVVGATAEVPYQYLQWKPNYKYTYLFKISENSNGHAGSTADPVGLYPITFDAIEVVNGDGLAEYITTVSEPSITTFGVSAGKYVTGGSEYAAGSDIYATFMDGSNVKDFTLGGSSDGGVNVYHVTTPNATTFKITEASVAEAIANPGSITNPVTNPVYTCTVTYTKVTDATTLADGTNYYKTDGTHAPGTTGYVPTLAVENTDYTISPSQTITDGVDIYTCAVSSVTPVTDPTTLAAGTTYYKMDTNTKAPDASGYIPTIAVEGTDYEVAPVIKATNINTDATTYFTSVPVEVTTVPGEDGVDITGTHALKLTSVAATTTTTAYAIEYIRDEAFTTDGGKTYATSEEFTAAGTLYTTPACNVVATSSDYTANPSALFYKKIINMPGTRVYKIIHVN